MARPSLWMGRETAMLRGAFLEQPALAAAASPVLLTMSLFANWIHKAIIFGQKKPGVILPLLAWPSLWMGKETAMLRDILMAQLALAAAA